MSSNHKNERSNVAMVLTMLFFAGLAILTLWVGKQDWRWGVVVCVGITIAIVLQGMRQLPASPPYMGLVTLFGEVVNKTIGPGGWHCLPLYPFMYGFIPFKVERVNVNLDEQSVRTPDLVDLGIKIQITFTPCHEPRCLNAYNNNGGEKGTINILVSAVRQYLREWAISQEEGPKTFEEALGASEEAIAFLSKRVELLANLTGIEINRLNIGDIKVLSPELAATIQEAARERHEREAEKENMKTVKGMVGELMASTEKGGLGLTEKVAVDLVQTESGVVKKDIQERHLSVDAALRRTLEGIAQRFFR